MKKRNNYKLILGLLITLLFVNTSICNAQSETDSACEEALEWMMDELDITYTSKLIDGYDARPFSVYKFSTTYETSLDYLTDNVYTEEIENDNDEFIIRAAPYSKLGRCILGIGKNNKFEISLFTFYMLP